MHRKRYFNRCQEYFLLFASAIFLTLLHVFLISAGQFLWLKILQKANIMMQLDIKNTIIQKIAYLHGRKCTDLACLGVKNSRTPCIPPTLGNTNCNSIGPAKVSYVANCTNDTNHTLHSTKYIWYVNVCQYKRLLHITNVSRNICKWISTIDIDIWDECFVHI